MKKVTTLALALLIGANFATAADPVARNHQGASAQNHHQHAKRDGLPRGFEPLNLSEEQKAKIRAIAQSDREARPATDKSARREAAKQKMQNRREQERRLLDARHFDEQAAQKLIAERQQERLAVQQQQAERELRMLKKRHAIFQVLTPEQQRQYRQMQNEKAGKRSRP